MHPAPTGSAVPGPDLPGILPGVLRSGLLPPEPPVSTGAWHTARDRAADVGCVVVAAAIAFLVFMPPPGPGSLGLPDAPPLVNLAAGALSWLSLWWRRRWPVPLAVALVLGAVLVPTVVGAAALALFTVAVHRRAAVTAAVTLLAVVAGLVQHRLHPIDPDTPVTYWVTCGIHALVCLLAATWGVTVRARRQLVLSLAERTRRAEADQQERIRQARQRERERISREMHDVLAHRLSLLSMHAGALEFRPDASPETVAEAAGVIRASAHQSLVDLREILAVLRAADHDDDTDRDTDGDALHPQPGLHGLGLLVEETRRAGTVVTVRDEVTAADAVPAVLGRTAFRVAQEGLTNARKHAPGAPVAVSLTGGPGDGLTVAICNRLAEGAPAPEVPGSGTGLVGLAERAVLAGGRLEHGPTAHGEYRLCVWLPWPA
ncbi:sensor histidine kinase [Pseudonocardia xinjiangensis]|uniref:histidine kinase n=1 Tax=Pseudonocardia xinjiangensis TaxID=75289 RepID=A0ABX1RHI2_9PSEU|nr:histidine kinase [Pseudonocardia xinjiangensis]NMH79842.1 sensor histidine kinase [Pseudonocardia xinjiangensis]